MIGTLIESRARRQRRAGGSIASVVAHAALIGGAVIATAQEKMVPPPPPTLDTLRYVQVRPDAPPPTPTRSRSAAPSLPAAPTLPALQVPNIIPTSIPPIDFSVTPTPIDYTERRGREGSIACGIACARDGVGRDTATAWVGNEVWMRLRDPVVPPRYPERLRAAGIDGRVVVKFVVDTLGRVDAATVEIVESTHELFTAAVREALAKLRFNPAMAGSRKIAAAAVMPFEFRLR